jgi:hypothetical protein
MHGQMPPASAFAHDGWYCLRVSSGTAMELAHDGFTWIPMRYLQLLLPMALLRGCAQLILRGRIAFVTYTSVWHDTQNHSLLRLAFSSLLFILFISHTHVSTLK